MSWIFNYSCVLFRSGGPSEWIGRILTNKFIHFVMIVNDSNYTPTRT